MENRTTIQITEDLRKELRKLSSNRDISYQELLKDMIDVFKELDPNKTIISIPENLSKKIQDKIEPTDIKTVSEYVVFILRMVLSEPDATNQELESTIKKKLKDLGYL